MALLRPGGARDQRVATLKQLGVGLVRYTLNWRELEPTHGSYDWSSSDPILNKLHQARIGVVATLWGTPRWANGRRARIGHRAAAAISPTSPAKGQGAIASSNAG
jgi:beta-galactosidase GanA